MWPRTELACAFPTSLDAPDHIALAEELGYARARLYDTPQQSPDVWMMLALAAQRTSRIGLGPGVLVPSLRHPMVNAAATAALAALAPGRVAVAFGTGFSGRRAMGYGPVPWDFMAAYLDAYRGLLRGDEVVWEGARMRMLHPPGHGAPRPVVVPILVGALGPKGDAVARSRADGLYAVGRPPAFATAYRWVAFLAWGTVLDAGEDRSGERVRAAAGPGVVVAYHTTYKHAGAEAVRALPGGDAWLDVVARIPADRRHLAAHTGHLVELNEADTAAWHASGSILLTRLTLSGTAEEVRERIDELASEGVTELVFQLGGLDIRRELARFLEAAQSR